MGVELGWMASVPLCDCGTASARDIEVTHPRLYLSIVELSRYSFREHSCHSLPNAIVFLL